MLERDDIRCHVGAPVNVTDHPPAGTSAVPAVTNHAAIFRAPGARVDEVGFGGRGKAGYGAGRVAHAWAEAMLWRDEAIASCCDPIEHHPAAPRIRLHRYAGL